jgi:hypothetical protein
MKRLGTIGLTLVALLASVAAPTAAQVLHTCDVHNGMKIWFVDMDDKNRPLAVRQGTVEINEAIWQRKCKADRMGEKIYIPFNYINAQGKPDSDTRWPFNVYRTRAEAQRNLNLLLGAHPQ